MSKYRKIILLVGGLVSLLVVIAVALALFVDIDVFKTRLQVEASEVLGMDVTIDGRLGVALFPGISLSMHDVHVRNSGKEILASEKIGIGFELIPLLQNRFNITGVALDRPRFTIERDADGRYNFEQPQTTERALPAVSLARISLSDGRFSYVDKGSGVGVDADGCRGKLRDMRVTGEGADILKAVSFTAKLSCSRMRTMGYPASDLRISAAAQEGVIEIKPFAMQIFGGQGSGSLRLDYSGVIPHYRVGFVLPQFRIERLVKTQSDEAVVTGPMSFSTTLSLQGETVQQLKQSAAGEVALQGRDLRLKGHDLDQEFSRFESSQNFNLLDMGALFIAGPMGMAVTKGYDFANVLKGSGGSGDIRTFVSRWKVEHGVMHAQDVAMATNRYRMALLGGLDIAHARFVDVTLALLNHQGCAEVRQKITGPFERPVVKQPNILKSVAGPVLKLLERGRKLLPGGECRVIYSGRVAPPR